MDAHRCGRSFLPRLDREVRDSGAVVDVNEVGTAARKRLLGERLGEPSVERDDVRDVVLVSVRVDHHEDQPEAGKHVEELATDELGILQRHLRR